MGTSEIQPLRVVQCKSLNPTRNLKVLSVTFIHKSLYIINYIGFVVMKKKILMSGWFLSFSYSENVWVCLCVRERKREKERERVFLFVSISHNLKLSNVFFAILSHASDLRYLRFGQICFNNINNKLWSQLLGLM